VALAVAEPAGVCDPGLDGMNDKVLLSPVGAKRTLLRAFDAIAVDDVEIHAGDSDLNVPALIGRAQALQTPAWAGSNWADRFLGLCRENKISLVVSVADRELNALDSIAIDLKASGVKTLLPTIPGALAICQNKRLFVQWCTQRGLPTPRALPTRGARSVKANSAQFPLFARPAIGQGSVGTWVVKTPEMMAALEPMANELIIQEMVTDPEYSIDVLSSFDGQTLQAVVRRRLVVRGGESTTTQVVQCPELEALALRVCDGLGLVGHSLVQAFWSERNGPRLIEVNPRFGGASTLSIRAGLDSPKRIIGMLRGDPDAYRNRPIQIGLIMHRVAEDIFVEPTER
jgi:carbamoyl-phosphate synthase large subunit